MRNRMHTSCGEDLTPPECHVEQGRRICFWPGNPWLLGSSSYSSEISGTWCPFICRASANTADSTAFPASETGSLLADQCVLRSSGVEFSARRRAGERVPLHSQSQLRILQHRREDDVEMHGSRNLSKQTRPGCRLNALHGNRRLKAWLCDCSIDVQQCVPTKLFLNQRAECRRNQPLATKVKRLIHQHSNWVS